MLKDEFKDDSQLKFHKQIKKGEVMHYIFSLLGNLSGKDPDAELSRCFVLAQSRFPEFDDFAGLLVKIKALLKDPRFKELFFCGTGRVFTEKEVVNRFGDTKRIDRLILKDDEAVIVDFKSGTEWLGLWLWPWLWPSEAKPWPCGLSEAKPWPCGLSEAAPLPPGLEEAQTKQVKEYIDLILAIYPKKKVRGCLLYVDELKIKEVT
jgi:hypothetical protein